MERLFSDGVIKVLCCTATLAWGVNLPAAAVIIKGTLAKVDLVNPHSWFWVDVKNKDGSVTHWAIEGGPPNGLIRNGITKDTLKLGEEITVYGYGARDGANQKPPPAG